MNKFIEAIKKTDFDTIEAMIKKDPKWLSWAEDNGKNALHYLGSVSVDKNPVMAESSLIILKFLLKNGMDINSVNKIPDNNCGIFPATPLWYAYTRGQNENLYKYLLQRGADPDHCMYAIAWYDDAEAAPLFQKHGAEIDDGSIGETPFLSAYNWKRFTIAEWFLKNGANVNFADNKGNTALYYAVKRKHRPEQISMLLNYGADMDHDNNEGISPKKMAEINRQRNILNLFKNHSLQTQ